MNETNNTNSNGEKEKKKWRTHYNGKFDKLYTDWVDLIPYIHYLIFNKQVSVRKTKDAQSKTSRYLQPIFDLYSVVIMCYVDSYKSSGLPCKLSNEWLARKFDLPVNSIQRRINTLIALDILTKKTHRESPYKVIRYLKLEDNKIQQLVEEKNEFLGTEYDS